MLVIEACGQCPECSLTSRCRRTMSAAGHARHVPGRGIPDWCPLLDAPRQENAVAALKRLLAALDDPQLVGDVGDALIEAREAIT